MFLYALISTQKSSVLTSLQVALPLDVTQSFCDSTRHFTNDFELMRNWAVISPPFATRITDLGSYQHRKYNLGISQGHHRMQTML